MRSVPAACLIAILVIGLACGSNAELTLSDASVQPSYVCPSGTGDSPYDLHATVKVHNGTATPVSIKSVSAVMTLAAVHGGWLQQVGFKYDAGNVNFAPDRVGPGADATIQVTIPSACRGKSVGPLSYADYSVEMAVATSAGTFKVETKNRHRIVA